MPVATCARCRVTATIRLTGKNTNQIDYDIPAMADRCVVLQREHAETGHISIGPGAPECPHLWQAITDQLNRARGR